MHHDLTDEQLHRGLLVRDESCLEELLRRHASGLMALMWRRVRSHAQLDDVQDLLQEVALKIWMRPDRFDASRSGTTVRKWMNQVARGVAGDFAKKYTRRAKLLALIAEEPHLVEAVSRKTDAAIDYSRIQAAIDTAIARLSKSDAEILLLFLADQSNSEIAAALGVTPSVARTRLSRARKRIRNELPPSTLVYIKEVADA